MVVGQVAEINDSTDSCNSRWTNRVATCTCRDIRLFVIAKWLIGKVVLCLKHGLLMVYCSVVGIRKAISAAHNTCTTPISRSLDGAVSNRTPCIDAQQWIMYAVWSASGSLINYASNSTLCTRQERAVETCTCTCNRCSKSCSLSHRRSQDSQFSSVLVCIGRVSYIRIYIYVISVSGERR